MTEQNEDYLKPLEFERIFRRRVGGIPMVFGKTAQDDPKVEPSVYAAALSGEELARERCGYGTTVSEAAVDLLRMMRPEPQLGLEFPI